MENVNQRGPHGLNVSICRHRIVAVLVALFCLPIILLAESYLDGSYDHDWSLTPEGASGEFSHEGKGNSLTLKSTDAAPSPMWILGNLNLESDVFYSLKISVKADKGTHYRVYVENAGSPEWRNRGLPTIVSDGELLESRMDFSLSGVSTPSYVVIQIQSPGSLTVYGVDIARIEKRDLKQLLEGDGIIDLLVAGEEGSWIPPSGTQCKGSIVELADRKGAMALKIENGGEDGPFWSRDGLPLSSDTGYVLSYSAKSEPGTKFRVYVGNNTEGRVQNQAGEVREGTGNWVDYEEIVTFNDVTMDSFLVAQILNPGEVMISDIKISR